MAIRIRPYPFLTIVTGAALVALGYLTIWQFHRAEWKRDLVEAYELQAEMTPLPVEQGLCGAPDEAAPEIGVPVSTASVEARLAVSADREPALRMFGRSVQGEVGWRLFNPVVLGACSGVDVAALVETGFDPVEGVTQAFDRSFAPERYVITPWPERPSYPPANAPERNEWYWFDADRMSSRLVAPNLDREIILVASSGTPDFLTRTPPSRHIGYAVTWLGMAIALAVVYVFLHVRAGRFRISDKTG